MKKKTLRAFAILLCIAALGFAVPQGTAHAAAATDIPKAYVLYDGANYYLIDYQNLLDSYMAYTANPNSDAARLAKLYFDTLAGGFESRFIAYVSSVTNKYVSYGAVLDKYMATQSVTETYTWFNSSAATSAFTALTDLSVLDANANVQGHKYVDASGYEVPMLVPNPSVETVDPADPTQPEHWSTGNFGNNSATFTYLNTGHTGSRSVKVEVTNYVDGDAKWYFDPIPLDHRGYKVSEYYESNVATNVIVAVDTTEGNKVYINLPSAPASASWTSYEATFTMPANGVTATVYQVLDKNGWLTTDDYRIDPYDVQTELIANPSVETVNPSDSSLPANWQNNAWGSQKATFTYLNTGHTGNRSVEVQVSGYIATDPNVGDAKWFFDPIALTPGSDYLFSDYYKSDVDTRVILAIDTTGGTTVYMDLPMAPANTSWTNYRAEFSMPSNGVTVSVYHVLVKNGYLITDDYKIDPYSYVGFNRGLVTLTFDDGWEENTVSALPVMQQYGFKCNQFYATTYIQNDPWADPELIRKFITDGDEIGSHSVTHPDLTTLTAAQVQQELTASKQFLESHYGITVHSFATPYGAYNTAVKNAIMTYYTAHRTVDVGYNSKDNFDVSKLKVQNILNTTTAADIAGWVQKAKNEHLWLIIVYHRVVTPEQAQGEGGPIGDYDTSLALFTQQMQAIHDAGITVVTMSQAITELNGQ